MIQRVQRFVARHELLVPGTPVLVAVSGGVDSMVLLDLLVRLKYQVEVAHVDHGLRGSASDADRSFVVATCKRLDLPCHVLQVEPREMARVRKVSIQMASRTLRLAALKDLATERGTTTIALAHHADDAVETLFLHLLRGIGTRGWGTIPVCSGPFIRPLLGESRACIEAYAVEHGIEFREDASNSDRKYLRNRVRHDFLPRLAKARPGAMHALHRSVDVLRDLAVLGEERLVEMTSDLDLDAGVPLDRIRDLPHLRLVLAHLLRREALHPHVVDEIQAALENGRTGLRFGSGPRVIELEYGHLRRSKAASLSASNFSVEIGADLFIPKDVPLSAHLHSNGARIMPNSISTILLDPDRIQFPLFLRPWRPGDRMRPSGMSGTRTVGDILSDAKVPRHQRAAVHVLCSGEEIIWLVGYRVAQGFQVDPDRPWTLRLDWLLQEGSE